MTRYRDTYHHGDARAALLRAGFDLARAGGPATVTLRAAARKVGITATAVYRHFAAAEDLLAAVKGRTLAVLAERLDTAVSSPSDVADHCDRMHAVAEAYVSFARDYPGLFAMACHGGVDEAVALVAARVGDVPYCTALAVWSAAHGVAALTGPESDQSLVLDIVLAGVAPAE